MIAAKLRAYDRFTHLIKRKRVELVHGKQRPHRCIWSPTTLVLRVAYKRQNTRECIEKIKPFEVMLKVQTW